jgi:hypothetical protein
VRVFLGRPRSIPAFLGPPSFMVIRRRRSDDDPIAEIKGLTDVERAEFRAAMRGVSPEGRREIIRIAEETGRGLRDLVMSAIRSSCSLNPCTS